MAPNEYIPGVCNIGEAEIANRTRKLKLALSLVSILTLLFLFLSYSTMLFAITAGLSCYASILFFQIRHKFCIAFGWKNVFNFKQMGDSKGKVLNEEWRRMDQVLVIKILVYSLLSMFLFMSVIFLVKKII